MRYKILTSSNCRKQLDNNYYFRVKDRVAETKHNFLGNITTTSLDKECSSEVCLCLAQTICVLVEIDFEVVSKDSDGHVSIPGSAAQKFGGSLNIL